MDRLLLIQMFYLFTVCLWRDTKYTRSWRKGYLEMCDEHCQEARSFFQDLVPSILQLQKKKNHFCGWLLLTSLNVNQCKTSTNPLNQEMLCQQVHCRDERTETQHLRGRAPGRVWSSLLLACWDNLAEKTKRPFRLPFMVYVKVFYIAKMKNIFWIPTKLKIMFKIIDTLLNSTEVNIIFQFKFWTLGTFMVAELRVLQWPN